MKSSYIYKKRFLNLESVKDFCCILCNNISLNWIVCLSCKSIFCLSCFSICAKKGICQRCKNNISNFAIEKNTSYLLSEIQIRCENKDCQYISNIENVESHWLVCPNKDIKNSPVFSFRKRLVLQKKIKLKRRV